MRMHSFFSGLGAVMLLLSLAACGGGSGGGNGGGGTGGSGGGSTSTVSGVAAVGSPLVGATVTLKDSVGNSQTATTAADGSYSVNVGSLTAPFLLAVNAGSNVLYSYASQGTSTANLNPYTAVLLQSYYQAQGTSVSAVFGGSLSASSFPSASQLALLVAPVVNTLQPYLSNAGVAQPTSFRPSTRTAGATLQRGEPNTMGILSWSRHRQGHRHFASTLGVQIRSTSPQRRGTLMSFS